MVARKPLVVISGQVRELPTADTLAPVTDATAAATAAMSSTYGGTMAPNGLWTAAGTFTANGGILQGLIGGQLVRVGRACTIDQLAASVTTVGSAGSVVRLGIYSISFSAGVPQATLLVDAGTISGTAVAVATKTLGTPLVVDAGTLLWLVAVGQGSPVTQPNMACGGHYNSGMGSTTAAGAMGLVINYTNDVTTVSGALPSTPNMASTTGSVPRVAFHCSA